MWYLCVWRKIVAPNKGTKRKRWERNTKTAATAKNLDCENSIWTLSFGLPHSTRFTACTERSMQAGQPFLVRQRSSFREMRRRLLSDVQKQTPCEGGSLAK